MMGNLLIPPGAILSFSPFLFPLPSHALSPSPSFPPPPALPSSSLPSSLESFFQTVLPLENRSKGAERKEYPTPNLSLQPEVLRPEEREGWVLFSRGGGGVGRGWVFKRSPGLFYFLEGTQHFGTPHLLPPESK